MTVTILIFDTTTILIYYSKNYCELDPLISRESTLSSYQFLLLPHYTVKSKRLLISTFTHTRFAFMAGAGLSSHCKAVQTNRQQKLSAKADTDATVVQKKTGKEVKRSESERKTRRLQLLMYPGAKFTTLLMMFLSVFSLPVCFSAFLIIRLGTGDLCQEMLACKQAASFVDSSQVKSGSIFRKC